MRLSLGKKFPIGSFINFSLNAGIGINKFDNTYVTGILIPSNITNSYGTIDGIISINLIDSGIFFPIIADADLTFNVSKKSQLGFCINLSEGYFRYLSAGLRLYTSLK
jgi:hypothetical protein